MEKIKGTILFILVSFLFINSQAAEPAIIRKGLLSTQLTISPAILFTSKQSFFYLHGNFEGYISSKISVAGEVYFSLGNASSATPVFKFNHNIFFGASYHIIKNNNDFYLGLQPGISITKVLLPPECLYPAKTGVDPLVSAIIGYNYYVNNYFHFFLQGRFIGGQHLYDIHENLSEFRFSAGLGFNINSIKK
jgi:hypothetical protein